MSGAPARGTAPRRPRRHHHHHHHHHHHDEPSSDDSRDRGKVNGREESRPKVNPIFLWALQREQRIVEVRCEDYDKRNRIKLTKTAQGWRSIPRTASNVYTSLGANGIGDCQHRVCENPAISSPNSSRWSPATISSSTVAPWSVSSTKSLAVSSPALEEQPPGRDSSSARSRHRGDEAANDFDDDRIGNASLLRLGEHSRKRRRRERCGNKETAKRRRKIIVRLRNPGEDRAAIETWNGGPVDGSGVANNQNLGDDSDGPVEGMENANGRASPTKLQEGKKRRRERRRIDEAQMERESESRENRSDASSPRSWELLVNGRRFPNSGPTVDSERGAVHEEEDNEEGEEEAETDEEEVEEAEVEYDEGIGSVNRTNHFGSMDLERAKRDRHLQPRVVLEQLHLTRSENGFRRPLGIAYEDDIEEEEETFVEESKPEDETRRRDVVEKTEIRDMLRMLDPTGSPVLATDTPAAHLPSPLDSTKTNISGCYEIREQPIAIGQRCGDEREKARERSSRDSYTSTKEPGKTAKVRRSENSFAAGSFVNSTRSECDVEPSRTCDSPQNPSDGERIAGGKVHPRENICQRVDSSSSELGTSSEILQALRSTPGLSISITTRVPACETRLESPENIVGARNTTKRPSSALYLERLLPGPRQPRHPGAPSPCCGSSEVTCSEDARSEITLEGILATPARPPPRCEKISGSGLAAVVSRLASRRNDVRRSVGADRRHQRGNARPNLRRQIHGHDETPGGKRRRGDSIECEIAKSPSSRFREQRPHPRRARGDTHRNPGKTNSRMSLEPANQLRELVASSRDAIPDPLLVPRDRLPALAAAPALEIPKLLASRPELRLPEALARPDLLRDPDLLVISLAHLQRVLDHSEGPVTDYTYRPPHPLAVPLAEGDDEEVDEEDELEEDDDEDDDEDEDNDDDDDDDDVDDDDDDNDDVDDDDDDEDEDLDVPEQSLNLTRSETLNGTRGRNDTGRTQRVPPKLISCKPIGSLMPGPMDLSRSCVRSLLPPRQTLSSISASRQQDLQHTQLPPPPLLRVRTGLLKQESEVTSTEISPPCIQDDSHLWHPLFGSQKVQRQQLPEQQQQQQNRQKQQQQHRTSWHRTTLAS